MKLQLLSATSSSTNSIRLLQIKKNEAKVGERLNSHKNPKEVNIVRSLVSPLMAALVGFSPFCYTPVSIGQSIEIQRGATLFRQTCIGCHDGGGNIIQPGATLYLKDLQKNGVETEDKIYEVTYFGKGRMPGFGKDCTPRGQCTFGPRLDEASIKILAEYVKSQADQGWPTVDH